MLPTHIRYRSQSDQGLISQFLFYIQRIFIPSSINYVYHDNTIYDDVNIEEEEVSEDCNCKKEEPKYEDKHSIDLYC